MASLRGELVATFGRASARPLREGVRRVAFARGSSLLASANADEARVEVASTGEIRHTFEASKRARAGEPVFTQDGTAFFLRDDGNVLECRRLDDGTALRETPLERRLRRLRSVDAAGERVVVFSSPKTGKPETFVVSTIDGRVERVLTGTTLPKSCVALPDGGLAVALQPSGLELWGAGKAPPEIVRPPAADAGACEELAVSADGRTLLACWSRRERRASSRNTHRWLERIDLADPSKRVLLRDDGPHQHATSLAISRDGARIAFTWETTDGVAVFVIDRDRVPVWTSGFVPGRTPTALAFSDDGRHLAVGCESGDSWSADLSIARPLVEPADHRRLVRALSFSADGGEILAVTEALTLHAHDIASATSTGAWPVTGNAILHASRSRDGKIALLDGTALRVLDPATGRVTEDLLPGPVFVRAGFAVSIDPRLRVAVRFDLRTREVRRTTLVGFPRDQTAYDLLSGALSPNGALLALCIRQSAETARLWDLESGAQLAAHENLTDLRDLSPNGRLLALRDGELVLVERDRRQLPGPGVARRPIPFAVNDDSTLFAAWIGDVIELWDLSGVPVRRGEIRALDTMLPPPKNSAALVFSPDGTQLAVSGPDRRVRVWRV